MINIVTDSSCDLPEEYIKKNNIRVVPLYIRFDDEEYLDGVDITPREFYDKMYKFPRLPKTAQPSPAAFLRAFKESAKEGAKTLCITMTSKLSGTFQSANIAKKMSGLGDDVVVFDSLSATGGLNLQIMKAVDMIKQSFSMDEIIKQLEKFRDEELTMVALLDTLENVVKGGRLSKFTGAVAKLLNIKAILDVVDGTVVLAEKLRGKKQMLERALERIGEKVSDFSKRICYITHVDNLEDAKYLKQEIINRFKPLDVIISYMSPTISTYAGKGGIVIFL